MNAPMKSRYAVGTLAGSAGVLARHARRLAGHIFLLIGLALLAMSAQCGSGPGHAFVCTDYTQGKVFIVSPEGKIEWEYDGATNANDIWVLPGGNLLFNTGHGVKEVTRDKPGRFPLRLVQRDLRLPAAGQRQHLHRRMHLGRLLEVGPDGKIVKELRLLPAGKNGGHAYMRNARRLDNGNYLVAHYGEAGRARV